MKKKQSRRARREFKPEFKNDIVRLVRTSGQSVTQIARDMDLTPSAVRACPDHLLLFNGHQDLRLAHDGPPS